MPAVLVELAFISNPQEEALLKDLEWLKVVGNGLAAAIDAYLKK
jgi:N-acetylmuramoyl-L-alanine amidase